MVDGGVPKNMSSFDSLLVMFCFLLKVNGEPNKFKVEAVVKRARELFSVALFPQWEMRSE